MDKNQKIIIVALIGIIIVLSGAILGGLLKEPSKTVELFENGTTITVSENNNLKSHDEFSTTYITDKNTTIIGVDNNNLVGALASKMLSNVIVEKGEKQENGLYKLDKNSVMEIGDQLGLGYDEKNIKEVFIGIKHNTTVNQSIILIGIDEKEMTGILDSIHWKLGKQSNITSADNGGEDTSTPSSSDKTYPFIADDGSTMGYYHVGDTVDYMDNIFQLKSDGSWVIIGESKGSSNNAYNQGYNDALDDNTDDTDSDSSSSDNSKSDSSKNDKSKNDNSKSDR